MRVPNEMNFPVWSRAISSKFTVKVTLGSVDILVVCAGALVTPRDAIVGDDDGVVVVPSASAEKVMQKAVAREALGAEKRAKLASGVLGSTCPRCANRLRRPGCVTSIEAGLE